MIVKSWDIKHIEEQNIGYQIPNAGSIWKGRLHWKQNWLMMLINRSAQREYKTFTNT